MSITTEPSREHIRAVLDVPAEEWVDALCDVAMASGVLLALRNVHSPESAHYAQELLSDALAKLNGWTNYREREGVDRA